MKKLLVILSITFAYYSTAQNVQIVSGSPDNLQKESELNVEFDYSNLEVMDDNLSEATYIENRSKDLNEKNTGEGDRWEKKWNNAKTAIWQPKFLDLLNKYVGGKVDGFTAQEGLTSAKYTLIVVVEWIYPGWDVYVSKKPAKLTTTLKFVETDNRDNVLLELKSEHAPGDGFGNNFSN